MLGDLMPAYHILEKILCTTEFRNVGFEAKSYVLTVFIITQDGVKFSHVRKLTPY